MRLYREIKQRLQQLCGNGHGKRHANHLETLTSFVFGIIKSNKTRLANIAGEIPNVGKEESKIMKLRRWLSNESISYEVFFMPFISVLLKNITNSVDTMFLVIDGSVTARGCTTLMVSVAYQGRAIPLMWLTRKKKKGHFPQQMHIELITAVHDLIPSHVNVVCLGDGEFDGVEWLETLTQWGWGYVCRTASNAIYYKNNLSYSLSNIKLQKGQKISVPDVQFTEKKYDSLMVIAWWRMDCKKPLYLITNIESVETACLYYKKRFSIETLFSDLKSRGFNLQQSGLSDPKRVERLLIVVAIAYIWVVYLGLFALHSGWHQIIHRRDRCDLSLFELGKRLLKRCLTNNIPMPELFIDFKAFTERTESVR